MNRIIIASLALHWALVLGLMAGRRLGLDGGAVEAGWLNGLALPAALLLAAMLFGWLALSGLAARPAREVSDLAELAGGTAILVLTASWIAGANGAGVLSHALIVLQVAALAATYVAIRMALTQVERRNIDGSRLLARRLAIGAAHSSALARLAGRGPRIGGSDA